MLGYIGIVVGCLCLGGGIGFIIGHFVGGKEGTDNTSDYYEDSLDLCKTRIEQIEDRNPFEGPDGRFVLDSQLQEERSAWYLKKYPEGVAWHPDLKVLSDNITELVV